jgi:UDP-glucose 4-epimerase
MREQLGFEPAFTTAEAFADFAAGLTPTGGRIEKVLTAALDRLPPVDEPPRLHQVGGGSHG